VRKLGRQGRNILEFSQHVTRQQPQKRRMGGHTWMVLGPWQAEGLGLGLGDADGGSESGPQSWMAGELDSRHPHAHGLYLAC